MPAPIESWAPDTDDIRALRPLNPPLIGRIDELFWSSFLPPEIFLRSSCFFFRPCATASRSRPRFFSVRE